MPRTVCAIVVVLAFPSAVALPVLIVVAVFDAPPLPNIGASAPNNAVIIACSSGVRLLASNELSAKLPPVFESAIPKLMTYAR